VDARWTTKYFKCRNAKGFGFGQAMAITTILCYMADYEYISKYKKMVNVT